MEINGQRRPVVLGQIEPKREASMGLFHGPVVGCWAKAPSDRRKRAAACRFSHVGQN
jgi:hypothetical protein